MSYWLPRHGVLFVLLTSLVSGLLCAAPVHRPYAWGSAAVLPARERRPRTVMVAAVQCSSVLGDVAGNRRKLTALVREAATHGAKIIVLPETAVTGYLSQDLRT